MASSVEVQFEEICRACMGCVQENPEDKTFTLLSIFDFVNDSQRNRIQICDALNIAVPKLPKVDAMDEMPSNICVRCLEKLFACYEFQNACLNSDKRLRDLIQMTSPQVTPQITKENDYNEQSTLIKQELCENRSHSPSTDSSPPITENFDYEAKASTTLCLQENNFVENESLDIKEELADGNSLTSPFDSENVETSCEMSWQCENCSQYFNCERLLAKHSNECALRMENKLLEPINYFTGTVSKPAQTEFETQTSFNFLRIQGFQNSQTRLTENSNTSDKITTWSCEICGNKFLHKRSVHRHMRLLHNIDGAERGPPAKRLPSMSLGCNECHEVFETTTSLNHHKNLLHDKLPYKCKNCTKAFKSLSHLKNHEIMHDNDQIFVCAQCDLTFKNIYQLRQHSRIHDNQKPYECAFCPEKFRCYSSVYSHQRRVHKDLSIV